MLIGELVAVVVLAELVFVNILSGEEHFPLPDFFEKDMLEFVDRPNSRLACQLELENVPDNTLVVRIKNGQI